MFLETKSGLYDLGITDLGFRQRKFLRTIVKNFTIRQPNSNVNIELNSFKFDRGITWEVAKEKFVGLSGEEGLYIFFKCGMYKLSSSLQ